ncbi:hypothetical protein GCM10028787_00850 [Brachybacterium horti]
MTQPDPQQPDPRIPSAPEAYDAQPAVSQYSASQPSAPETYGAVPTEPAYGAGAYGAGTYGGGQAPQGRQEAGFLRALFDFTFTHFITVKFSSFLYVIAIIVALLMWLLQIISGITFGAAWGSMNSYYGEGGFNAVPLILAILFGWIPSIIALLVFRLGLEFAVATVRTAQNTTEIAEQGRTAG